MKKYMQKYILFVLFLLLFTTTSCSSYGKQPYIDFSITNPEEDSHFNNIIPKNAENPFRIAVCAILPQKDTIDSYRLISERIGEELKRDTAIIERRSYAEINVLLANGGADIAFLANGAYASYSGIEEIEPLAMQVRFGVPYYYCYIIVPSHSSAKRLEDLRGKTFAFTDPISYSGKIALVYMLRQINETPETFFGNYVYTYGHQNSLEAVANNVIDAAAIGSHVYDDAKKNQPDLIEKIRIINVSDKGGTGPVVARKSLGQEKIQILQNFFLNMHKDSELKEAMSVLMIDHFIEPQMEYYEFVQGILKEMDTEL